MWVPNGKCRCRMVESPRARSTFRLSGWVPSQTRGMRPATLARRDGETRGSRMYALLMKKRITLSLDDDIVEALQARGARSLSAAANEALREAIADDAHRAALLAWLDELDAARGAPAPEQLAAADALLDALERGEPLPKTESGRVSAA
jgi:uncharacterized protein (DUF4415 family)